MIYPRTEHTWFAIAVVPSTPAGHPRTAGLPATGLNHLGIRDLEAAVDLFLEAGLAESSKKAYQAGWQKFLAICHSFHLPQTPITKETTTLFAAFLATKRKACSTIESYLATTKFRTTQGRTHSPRGHLPLSPYKYLVTTE